MKGHKIVKNSKFIKTGAVLALEDKVYKTNPHALE
jgi:hypothetical protein